MGREHVHQIFSAKADALSSTAVRLLQESGIEDEGGPEQEVLEAAMLAAVAYWHDGRGEPDERCRHAIFLTFKRAVHQAAVILLEEI